MIFKIILFAIFALVVMISVAYVSFCEVRENASQARHEERMKQHIDFNVWCKEADFKSNFMYMSNYRKRLEMQGNDIKKDDFKCEK